MYSRPIIHGVALLILSLSIDLYTTTEERRGEARRRERGSKQLFFFPNNKSEGRGLNVLIFYNVTLLATGDGRWNKEEEEEMLKNRRDSMYVPSPKSRCKTVARLFYNKSKA